MYFILISVSMEDGGTDFSACETDAELDSEVEDEDKEAEEQLTVWLDQLHNLQQVSARTGFWN